MITLDRVTDVPGQLSSVSLQIPPNKRIAVFGVNWRFARRFMNLLSGLHPPGSGRIRKDGRLSFPVGHVASFERDLSVRHNVEYVARLYGADIDPVVDLVRRISNLRDAFEKPFKALSAETAMRLSVTIAYSIPFDMYLHVTDVAAPAIKRQLGIDTLGLIESRLTTAGIMVPCRHLREACLISDTALLLYGGSAYFVDDVRDAALALDDLIAADRQSKFPRATILKKYFGKGF